MELELKGKKALVTGGSKGIGLAIKKALEAEGVEVISWSRGEGIDVKYDIPNIPDVDILINNVGGGGTWKIGDWKEVFEKNFDVSFNLTYQFINKQKAWGRVVTISSVYGKEKGGTPWFNAAKAAQISLMKNLSGTTKGTTFNTICPGMIDTGKFTTEQIAKHTVGQPEDVANIVAFLCSDKAKHIDGACIVIDGGESKSF